MPTDPKVQSNLVLSALSLPDLARLKPKLESIELPLRRQLETRNRPIEYAYFLDRGLASVVVTGGSAHAVEVGIIGREGMTGIAALLGAERSTAETFMQDAGKGSRIRIADLLAAMDESATLRRHLLRHIYIFQTQMAYTALANARYKIEERLARWLLMAQDRCGETVYLTHEFLSLMLGVRRPGVTVIMLKLEKSGIISPKRGEVTILDRAALEDLANGCYGTPEGEYERLFGTPVKYS